jgi:hypothetical protein
LPSNTDCSTDGAEDGPVLVVQDGDVGLRVGQDVGAPGSLVGDVAVGVPARVDGLDDLKGVGVEHGDGFAGGKAVVESGVDGGTMRGDAVDLADLDERVQIEDMQRAGRAGAGDVEPACGGVGIEVVGAALAADLGRGEHLVLGLCGHEGSDSQHEGGERLEEVHGANCTTGLLRRDELSSVATAADHA